MRYDDLEAALRLTQGEEEKGRMCQMVNELAERTMRGSLSAHWWLPLDCVSYAGVSVGDPSEVNGSDLFNLNAFPCGLHHQA